MAEIFAKIIKGYQCAFHEWADPRTQDWLLVAKPYQCCLLLGIYLMFVYKWGPRWMKNRPAFNLNAVLIAYNVIQIGLCVNVLLNSMKYWGWNGSYAWVCEPVDYTNSENGLFVANIAYHYYLMKIFDLLDTVFFVLRKKFNQVSFLHVYHHTGMVLLIWGAITYLPGGHGTYVGVLNSFVHTLMYTYYLLTITVPSVRKMIWFKKLITQFQIIQFLLLVVHFGSIIFIPDCEYPRWTVAIFLPQNLFMLILFLDFYIKTYVRKPTNRKTGTDIQHNGHNDSIHDKSSYVDISGSSESRQENNVTKTVYNIRNHDNFRCVTCRSLKCTQ